VLLGCGRTPTFKDSADLVVQPGVGISNICQLGMTFTELKRQARGASTHGFFDEEFSWDWVQALGKGRLALFPSLGAIAPVQGKQPIWFIEFHVRQYRHPMIAALRIEAPFRGKVGPNLTFAEGEVSKAQVEQVFGPVSAVLTNSAEALDYRKQGKSFVEPLNDAEVKVWYPKKGISFIVRSNVVILFHIYQPTGVESVSKERDLK
jgi:hypothetical protein